MLNQTKRLYKSKSKIFITILCIFGLLFYYSCNPTPYTPKTYTATRSGYTLIMVSLDGKSITPAKISFQDAKVTSVTVDVGATGIDADVFKYENGGLTMTAFDNVTTNRQEVTATFSLAPNDSRDTLNNPTEDVEIELVKSKGKFDKKVLIGETIKDIPSIDYDNGNIGFMFGIGASDIKDDKIVVYTSFNMDVSKDNTYIDKSEFIEKLKTEIIEEKVTGATSIEFVRDDAGTDTHSFVYKFKFPYGYRDYEQTEDQLQNGIEYTIEIKTKGKTVVGDEKTITFK